MQYETSVIYLEQVPKLVIDTGVDVPTLIGFAVTVVIFGLGTWLTVRTSNENSREQTLNLERSLDYQERALLKTIESQETVAAKNSLKASRQAWINDLRDASALFVAATMTVQRLNNFKKQRSRYWLDMQDANPAEHSRIISEWATDHIEAIKEVRRLKAKIELLLNPSEVDSISFMESVNAAEAQCDKTGESVDEPCRVLVERCQVILKTEWEKAKRGQ